MRYFLAGDAVLKWLETPSVYHIGKDDLYELDSDSFEFLNNCADKSGCSFKKNEFIDYCLKEGILTGDKVAIKRPPLIKSPDPSLRYLELQITNKCNLTCKHCYINPPPPPFNSPLTKEARLSSVGQGHRGGKTGFSGKNIDELSINTIKI